MTFAKLNKASDRILIEGCRLGYALKSNDLKFIDIRFREQTDRISKQLTSEITPPIEYQESSKANNEYSNKIKTMTLKELPTDLFKRTSCLVSSVRLLNTRFNFELKFLLGE